MLFNSYEFLFWFFPIAALGYLLLSRFTILGSQCWLIAASFLFYGWWNASYVALLLSSLIFNYMLGYVLRNWSKDTKLSAAWGLGFGVFANLSLLGFYKYSGFVADIMKDIGVQQTLFSEQILPLAISFFTFQQIAYLVQCYGKSIPTHGPLDFTLCIVFFPHLIAGPIVNPRELLPQITGRSKLFNFNWEQIAVGSAVVAIGLFKKTVIADNLANFVNPVFNFADPSSLSFHECWVGAFCYAFQLYFDFSGYCDMAVGLSYILGLKLPINFFSPYKAKNISDLWRRWHMTLSRFLTEYVYNPIAMRLTRSRLDRGLPVSNSVGPILIVYVIPTLITMFLSGIWHGAGWNYIAFGVLNGIYLSIFHLWRATVGKLPQRSFAWFSHALTFLTFVVALVLFRSHSLTQGLEIIKIMLLGDSVTGKYPNFSGSFSGYGYKWIYFSVVVVLFMPNLMQMVSKFQPALYTGLTKAEREESVAEILKWKPNWIWAAVCALAFVLGVIYISKGNEFLYFKF